MDSLSAPFFANRLEGFIAKGLHVEFYTRFGRCVCAMSNDIRTVTRSGDSLYQALSNAASLWESDERACAEQEKTA